jgi:hypothetical protein
MGTLKCDYKCSFEEGVGVSFFEKITIYLEMKEILKMCGLYALW